MTQENVTQNLKRRDRLRLQREEYLLQIDGIEEAQKKVAHRLLTRSKSLEGHLKLAHEFGAKMMGQLMHSGSWQHWEYSDEESAAGDKKRIDWTGYAGGTTAVNRLMAMASGSSRDESLHNGGALLLQTHEDVISVLNIASYLPGISSNSADRFADLDPEDFSPSILGRLRRKVHTIDEDLARSQKKGRA